MFLECFYEFFLSSSKWTIYIGVNIKYIKRVLRKKLILFIADAVPSYKNGMDCIQTLHISIYLLLEPYRNLLAPICWFIKSMPGKNSRMAFPFVDDQ